MEASALSGMIRAPPAHDITTSCSGAAGELVCCVTSVCEVAARTWVIGSGAMVVDDEFVGLFAAEAIASGCSSGERSARGRSLVVNVDP